MLALDLYPEVVRDFFSPEDWERIAAALQSPGRDEVCPGRLLASLAWIFERQPQEIFGPNLPEKPPTPEYRRTHAALKKQAEKVRSSLAAGDWRAGALERIISDIDDIAPEPDLDFAALGIRHYCTRAGEIVDIALAPQAGRGGRPRNWRLLGIIYELAKLYTGLTGREPGISRDVSMPSSTGRSRASGRISGSTPPT